MVSSEIKETIYVAITCTLIATVLGLVAFVLSIRSDFASVRNVDIATQHEMASYSEYNKYSGEVMYGEDVIALIRKCSNTSVCVYIDDLYRINGSHDSYFLQNNVVNEVLNSEAEMSMKVIGDTKNKGIKRDETYFAYLVFGEYTIDGIKKATYPKPGTTALNYDDVTAVVVKYLSTGRLSKEDSIIKNKIDAITK